MTALKNLLSRNNALRGKLTSIIKKQNDTGVKVIKAESDLTRGGYSINLILANNSRIHVCTFEPIDKYKIKVIYLCELLNTELIPVLSGVESTISPSIHSLESKLTTRLLNLLKRNTRNDSIVRVDYRLEPCNITKYEPLLCKMYVIKRSGEIVPLLDDIIHIDIAGTFARIANSHLIPLYYNKRAIKSK